MHRWYRAELYAQRIELIRRKLPAAAIGADVIVGFPGESAEDFAETVRFIKSLPLTYLHVFSFSTRPGTKAESLANAVPHEAIRERARELRALSAGQKRRVPAIAGGKARSRINACAGRRELDRGAHENYLKVRIAGRIAANEWREVRLTPAENEVCAQPGRTATAQSVFENDLRQRQVAAVGD